MSATDLADKNYDTYYDIIESECADRSARHPPVALLGELDGFEICRADYYYGLPEEFDDSEEAWAAYNASELGQELITAYRAAASYVVAAIVPWLLRRSANAAWKRRSAAVLACVEANSCHCAECEPPAPAPTQLHLWSF